MDMITAVVGDFDPRLALSPTKLERSAKSSTKMRALTSQRSNRDPPSQLILKQILNLLIINWFLEKVANTNDIDIINFLSDELFYKKKLTFRNFIVNIDKI